MITAILSAIGILIAVGFSFDVRRWVRDHWLTPPPPLAPEPQPEPNLPLSDAMRDAIRRDVSAAIDRDARTAWARGVMAFHASGHGVRKATVEELVGAVVEVARG